MWRRLSILVMFASGLAFLAALAPANAAPPAAQLSTSYPAPGDPPYEYTFTADEVEAAPPSELDGERGSFACKTVTGTQSATASGVTVFWLKLKVTWCYNGTSILTRSYLVTDYANGYLFWDTTTPTTTVDFGPPYHVYTREKMKHCPPLPWSGFCSYKWPWVEIYARRTGTYEIYHGTD